MTTGLGKSYSFGLLCVSFVNVYQFVCFFTFGFEDEMWDLIVFVPDHCLSFNFTLYICEQLQTPRAM